MNFFNSIENKHIGNRFCDNNNADNQSLIKINDSIRNHPVEIIGKELRASMTAMKKIV